jgi:diacylglycerol kinase (ATP)
MYFMKNERFTFRKRLAGFTYAFRGIWLLLRYGHSAWLHEVIGLCTVIAGFLFNISPMEWVAVIIVCGCVLAAEALNTAIELLADVVSSGYSDAIKQLKDLAAGAVLLMAFAAAIVGIIIFFPKIIALF